MSKSKIASTVVSSDGKGTVEVTTSSTITGGTPVNNLEKATSVKTDKSVNGLLGKLGGTVAGKALSAVGKEYAKNAYDAVSIYKKAKDFGNNLTKNIDSLGGQVLTNVLQNSGYLGNPSEIVDGILGASKGKPLSEMIKYQKDQVKFVVNGMSKVVDDIQDFDIESVGSVLTMINSIVGDENLATALDLNAEFAMLKELNNSSLLLGLAGSIDAILEYKKDKKEQRLLLLDGLPVAVSMSNLDYIKKTIEKCGLGATWSRCPDILTSILTNYRLPEDLTTPSEYSILQLIETLDSLAPNWEVKTGQGKVKYNLNVFNNISSDASSSLGLNERFKDIIAITGTYVSMNNQAAFKMAYPYY